MWRKPKNIKPEEERVISDPERARARTMNRAVRLLAAKPRSIGELRERLLEKNWTNSAIVDGVIVRLETYNYLDDAKYAADLAASKLRQKPQGKRKLQQAMSRKKLSRENIDNAISSAFERSPEDELIDQVIERRIRSKGVPQTREDTKRFYDHLLRGGFGLDLIRSKMNLLAKREVIEEGE